MFMKILVKIIKILIQIKEMSDFSNYSAISNYYDD